ncbi:MAG: [protein-PII] uridylyltransferase [Methylophaga sp.]|nr:MAG: [protein-PII] uridylyltransferase [Methylophaga sp.]
MPNILSLWDLSANETPNSSSDSAFFRKALQQGQDFLTQQFSDQVDVVHLVHQRAKFVDQVLQQLWSQHINAGLPISLLAVGGYGRGELHPYSDIDLLVLLDGSVSQAPPESLSDFLTQLWDIGLEIGHSVRTIAECREQAENDVTIATTLLETRLLCGETDLFSALQELTGSNKTWDTRNFYQIKKQEQQQRHLKYNDTANNLEPNIKEAPGGLRDLQVISWVAQQHFNVSDLQGLKQEGFLSDSEYEALDKAQHFLWKIRFALHLQAGRKEEKLQIDYQRELANQFGYKNTDKRLAVEQFMKDYYLCARSVQQMNSLLLQLFEEKIILADEPRHIEPINEHFHIHNGYLATLDPTIFSVYPYAMLELFLMLQQHPKIKGVRAETIRQLHSHLHLIDDRFRADPINQNLFMEIIRQPKGVSHEFRRMNELGVLGAYLPVFGVIVGQMQHDLFHIYTVDEHTLFLVRNLRRFSCSEYSDQFPLCSQIFYQLPKPELLYIAGLFHDIAKGRGGDHSLLGMVDAAAFCKQHHLNTADTETIKFLVRQHLTMSATAQKSDINDPDTIKVFAAKVKTVDRLNYLYLLTVADIRATNNNLWNGWRDSLLRQLYNATRNWLEDRHDMARNRAEKSKQRQQQALQQLTHQAWTEQQITTLWQHYDSDYFLHHTTNEIVWQTVTRLQDPSLETVINTRSLDQQNTLELFIFTEDKLGIFAAITACLESLQLDILDAKIDTTTGGKSLNSYILTGEVRDQNELIYLIEQQLNELENTKTFNSNITPRTMKLFETQPTLHFSTDTHQRYTTLELEAHDRLGLVSTLAHIFLQCNIHVISAKLTTLGDQVEDIFLISTRSHLPLNTDEITQLQEMIIEKLSLKLG